MSNSESSLSGRELLTAPAGPLSAAITNIVNWLLEQKLNQSMHGKLHPWTNREVFLRAMIALIAAWIYEQIAMIVSTRPSSITILEHTAMAYTSTRNTDMHLPKVTDTKTLFLFLCTPAPAMVSCIQPCSRPDTPPDRPCWRNYMCEGHAIYLISFKLNKYKFILQMVMILCF